MHSNNRDIWFAWFVFLLLSITYRASVYLSEDLAHSIIGPINFASLILGFVGDVLLGALLFYLLSRLRSLGLRCVLSTLLLGLFAASYIAAKHFYLLLNVQLSYASLMSIWGNHLAVLQLGSFLDWQDYFMIGMALLWPICLMLNRFAMQCIYRVLLSSWALVTVYALLVFANQGLKLHQVSVSKLFLNPVLALIKDGTNRLQQDPLLKHAAVSAAQQQSPGWLDEEFVVRNTIAAPPQVSTSKPWNVVMVVMESVGATYLDDEKAFKTRMPFLYSMAKNGLWLKQHYAGGNNSSLGAFALFSGYYPKPDLTHDINRHAIQLQNMASWLGDDYDRFFVTPADTRLYFPSGLIRAQGFDEFIDMQKLPAQAQKIMYGMYVKDGVALNYFLKRIQASRKPFFAVYWPCAAHFPYVPYDGSDLASTTPKQRYLRNLQVLDRQLAKIYQHLQASKLLDKTIMIITSDHGEGFGQHKGDGAWLHGAALYDEQVRIPTVFYQPKIFAAQPVDEFTSAVDVLPTLLDALQVSYKESQLQGESLLRAWRKRKYIFVYGDEHALLMLDQRYHYHWDLQQNQCVQTDSLQIQSSCSIQIKTVMAKYRNYQRDYFKKFII